MSDQVQGLSGKVGLDITDYKAGIVELNRNIRMIETGFRASSAALGDWDKTANGLEMRIEALNKSYVFQKDKVILLTSAYQKIAAEKGANSRAAQELQIKINKETESLNKMKRELDESESQLASLQAGSTKTGKEIQKLGNEEEKTAKKSDQLKSGTSNLGKSLGSILAKAAAVTASIMAIKGAISGLWTTIQKGSDLNETVSKVQVVFGDWSEDIQHWAKNADSALGMSQNQAMAAAGTFGNLFSAMGIGKETTYDMSTGLVQLSADLASFNNLDPQDVLDSLRSGISGETEPLKKLGININEATLKQKALEMGLWNGKGALDASAKAQASYALILQQTSLAQGDFERTSDGLANQQRTLTARIEDLKGALGTGLLPIVLSIVGQVSKYVDYLNDVLAPGLFTFEHKIQMVGSILKLILLDLSSAMPQIASTAVQVVQALVDGLIGALPVLIPAAIQIIVILATALIGMLPMLLEAGIQIIVMLLQGITQAIPQLFSAVIGIIPQIVMTLIDNLPLLIEAALNMILALATGLVAALPVLIPQIPLIVKKIVEILIQNLPLILVAAVQIIGALALGLVENLPMILTAVVDIIVTIVDEFKNTNWKEIGDNIVAGIKTGVLDKWEDLKSSIGNKFKELWIYIKGLLGIHSPSTVFAEIGANMAAGMGMGFGAQMNAVNSQIRGAINGMTANVNVPVNVSAQGGIAGQQVVSANGRTYQLYFETYNEAAMNRTLHQVEMLYG